MSSFFVVGWVCQRDAPGIDLIILVNNQEIGRVIANGERADIAELLGTRRAGFMFMFPRRLADGDVVRIAATDGRAVADCGKTYRVPRLGATRALGPNRAAIAARFLRGRGIEVGAFAQPTDIPPDREINFYDFLPASELRKFYDPSCGRPLMEPNFVGDAESLDGLESETFDFLIANHVIEHLHDPIRFVKSIAAKLAPGGRAMIAAPDKRFCFDSPRPLTTFDHLVTDHELGGQRSEHGHFQEWARSAYGLDETAARDWADRLDNKGRLFHFHVWDADSFKSFITRTIGTFALPLRLIYFRATRFDIIVVLEKAGADPRTSEAMQSH